MFVIKNTKTEYDCYLDKDNKWHGLVPAKIFNTEEEAKQVLPENGKICKYEEIIGLKK